jgi:hypothetical protein
MLGRPSAQLMTLTLLSGFGFECIALNLERKQCRGHALLHLHQQQPTCDTPAAGAVEPGGHDGYLHACTEAVC